MTKDAWRRERRPEGDRLGSDSLDGPRPLAVPILLLKARQDLCVFYTHRLQSLGIQAQ